VLGDIRIVFGGPIREEYEHLCLYIPGDMMVNPKDG